MAVPLMLSLLVQSLYNIVDSMFVARLSEDALTAASLVYSIQFLMIAVSVGTAVGLNALLSRKIGQQKTDEACRAATTGLFLTLFTSFLFSIAGIFFSDVIASKLTPDPTLQELCKQYLSINLVYCWGMFLQTYGQRLLQAVGDTVLSMLSLIIGAILNIILGIWRGNPKLSFYPTIHFPHQWHPLQPYLLLQVLHRGCIGTSVSPDGYDKPERFACTLWYAFGIR